MLKGKSTTYHGKPIRKEGQTATEYLQEIHNFIKKKSCAAETQQRIEAAAAEVTEEEIKKYIKRELDKALK